MHVDNCNARRTVSADDDLRRWRTAERHSNWYVIDALDMLHIRR